MTFDRDHRQSLRTLRVVGASLMAAVVIHGVLRLWSDGMTEILGLQLLALLAIGILSGFAGKWWSASTGSATLLTTLAAFTCYAHATVPAATQGLAVSGMLLVIATLILRSVGFLWFGISLILGLAVSHVIRLSALSIPNQPALEASLLLGGFTAFTLALWWVDRTHRSTAEQVAHANRQADVERQAAIDSTQAKGRFLANMSHELRSPLNAIIGYTGLLLEQVPERVDLIAPVQEAGEALLAEVNAILNLARREAQATIVPRMPISATLDLPPEPTAPILFRLPILLAGGTLFVAHTLRPELSDITPAVFFLLAITVILLSETGFRMTAGCLFAGYVGSRVLRWWSGWESLSDAIIPILAVGIVTAVLMEVVQRRGRHRSKLLSSITHHQRGRDAAHQAEHARDDLITQMSHRIRTPLTTILGFAELLEEDLTGEPAEDAHHIHVAGRHLLGIVDNVVDLRRVAEGELPFRPASTDLGTIVHEAVELSRSAIEANGNALQVDLAHLPMRDVDPGQVRQILVNLLVNAGKFTQDGRVALSATAVDHGRIRFAVVDTGPGIPEHELDRLFTAFERLSSSENTGGTGLGLTIAQHMAHLHGGALTVKSQVGVGSTFEFTV